MFHIETTFTDKAKAEAIAAINAAADPEWSYTVRNVFFRNAEPNDLWPTIYVIEIHDENGDYLGAI
jgi:hypothetical protein